MNTTTFATNRFTRSLTVLALAVLAARCAPVDSSVDSEGTSVDEARRRRDAGADSNSGDMTMPPSSTTPASVCAQGPQHPNSHGAEAPLGEGALAFCRRALGCDSEVAPSAPPEFYRNQGTPNHKLLWRLWYYGWAQYTHDAARIADARQFLVDFFDAQLTQGHGTVGADEALTTSHYQIWANGMTCARVLATTYSDRALTDATGRWWRDEFALYETLQHGGSIDAPGSRIPEGSTGVSPLRDVIYAMVHHRPLPGNASRADSAWWSDYYNVAAWTLRELQRRGDDLGGAANTTRANIPHLHDPLMVYTRGDDYVHVFPRMRSALDPMFWVARINGVRSHAPYTPGHPDQNPNPPPALPGATLTVIPGVN